jgi:hypothetical protein
VAPFSSVKLALLAMESVSTVMLVGVEELLSSTPPPLMKTSYTKLGPLLGKQGLLVQFHVEVLVQLPPEVVAAVSLVCAREGLGARPSITARRKKRIVSKR